MHIRELASQSGVSATAIRYYEAIGLLPPPQHDPNNYRRYSAADVERLRFVAGARRVGCSVDELKAILAVQLAGQAPCAHLLALLSQRIASIDEHIRALLAARAALVDLLQAGHMLPQDDPQADACICSLLRSYHLRGWLPPLREDDADD